MLSETHDAARHALRTGTTAPGSRHPFLKQEEMGLLIDGVWHDRRYDPPSTGGSFVRKEAAFRNRVPADGRPGPTGQGGFEAEADRYHLYISMACPLGAQGP